MLTLRARTNKGSQTISCPESWYEVTVEKYQRILREWDNDDWVQLFSILTDLEADSIANSTDGQMEGALYQSVQFVFTDFNWDGLKIPPKLKLQTLLAKDSPLIIDEVRIKNIGRMSIGQNIQARKSLEGMKDIREGLSIVTAIFIQPILDKSRYDHLRAIEIEQLILKMKITDVYALGFFLLKRLRNPGNWFTRLLGRLKKLKAIKSVRS